VTARDRDLQITVVNKGEQHIKPISVNQTTEMRLVLIKALKAYNRCQGREKHAVVAKTLENIDLVPIASAGKRAAGSKTRDIVHLVESAGKHVTLYKRGERNKV